MSNPFPAAGVNRSAFLHMTPRSMWNQTRVGTTELQLQCVHEWMTSGEKTQKFKSSNQALVADRSQETRRQPAGMRRERQRKTIMCCDWGRVSLTRLSVLYLQWSERGLHETIDMDSFRGVCFSFFLSRRGRILARRPRRASQPRGFFFPAKTGHNDTLRLNPFMP